MKVRSILSLVTAVIVVVGVLMLANEFSRQARFFVISKIDSVLTARNVIVAQKVHERMEIQFSVLRNFQTLFNDSPFMVRDIFELSAAVPKHLSPGITAVGFAPRIPRRERVSFSEYVSMEGYSRYRIHPMAKRDVYLPVQYVVPFETNRRLHGFDFASDSTLLSIIDACFQQDTILLTPLMRIESEDEQALFLFAPVFKLDTVRHQVVKGPPRGVCFVRINPRVFATEALLSTSESSPSFFRLYASAVEDHDALIYDGMPPSSSVTFDHKSLLRIGGQTWMFHFSANSRSQGLQNLELPMEVQIVGIFLAVTMGLLVFLAIYRRSSRV